jgi:hypothetical protein
MFGPKAHLAFWNYDRVRPLSEGQVKIDGVRTSFSTDKIVTQIFERMVRGREFDVSELGMTYYLRTLEAGDSPFVAIPVFPNRCFRHSAVYVHKASGITRPQDLHGKRVGELALYGHDSGLMSKGILSDEHGFRPEACRWVVGNIDFPLNDLSFVPHPHPSGVEVSYASHGEDLGEMLDRGEIEALFSADVPKCVIDNSPRVGRLFEDYADREREYFRRTGIFPIMHTVVVTREFAAKHPDAVRAIYDGFCEAKRVAAQQLLQGVTCNSMAVMVPWLPKLITDDRALLGEDWWPYGIAANRRALDAILRYHHEQGITRRRYTIDEIFLPELLST